MSRVKKIIYLSIIILLLSIIIHEYAPDILMNLLKIPWINQLSNLLHKIIRNSALSSKGSANIVENNAFIGEKSEKIFTANDLRKYDGQKGSYGLYLGILGLVFDVAKGEKYYSPESGYAFFAGRDGSRAFVSGDFTEKGLTDDISNLTPQDYIGLDEWIKFYKKEYKYIGKLKGRYYNDDGSPTQYYHKAQKWIAEAYDLKETENKEKKKFPPCNSEWKPELGSRVYCTRKSGGIERDWVGVPRKVIEPGNTRPKCACVKNFGPPSSEPNKHPHDNRGDLDHPHLKEFPGCEPDAESCKVIED